MAGSLLAHHVPHVHPLPPLQEEAWPCAVGQKGQAPPAKQHCSNLSASVLANDDDQMMKYSKLDPPESDRVLKCL